MSTAKIAISIDSKLLTRVDHLVKDDVFKNRSQAFQFAIEQTVLRMEHRRLAEECNKLDPKFEQAMADEGLLEDESEWPKY